VKLPDWSTGNVAPLSASNGEEREFSKMATARILIVDDEVSYLDALSRTLSRQGYDVLPAAGPRQALEIIRNTPPVDVVVSDVMMPEIRGTDLVREVAQTSPQTACILMTGGAVDWADIPQGVPVLRKPLSTGDLIVAVQHAAARSARLRASRQG
jgi:DNA-binding NtrC family response regulator